MRGLLRWLWDLFGGDVYTINLVLQAGFATAGMVGVWLFARRWLGEVGALITAVGTAGWLCWGFAPFTGAVSYPYDLPAFAFSALGLAAVVWRRYWLLALVIAVGCFNKETVFWLVPAWFFWAMKDPEHRTDRGEWFRSVGLGLLFVAVYTVPRLIFPQGEGASPLTMSYLETDPGAPTPGSLRLWQNFRLVVLLKPMYGFPWIHTALALHLAAPVLWRRLPADLRWLYAAAIFFVLPTIIVGNVWELRIFNELMPLSVTALLVALRPRPSSCPQPLPAPP
jgi:hypothetical protein